MNKKGFTLIEIIAVVSILAIIAIISVPKIIDTIQASRQKMYKEQESRLVQAASEYLADEYVEEESDSFSIDKSVLISGGYIEEVTDPRDPDDVCSGFVYVSNYTTTPKINAYISCDDYTTEDYTIYSTLTEYSVTNLATNGSFEENLSTWDLTTDITISSSKSKFGNYSAKNYHSAQYKGIKYKSPYITSSANHIYYMSSWMYTVNLGNAHCYMQLVLIYDSTNHYTTSSQNDINLWSKKSVLVTVPDVSPSTMIPCTVYTTATDALQECYGDGVLLVDLTATFGAGNEPTKEWCDKNLDYFDGTKTFNLPATS